MLNARIEPRFMPNLEVFLVFKKFALMAGRDGTKNCASKFGFEVDFVLECLGLSKG